MKKFLKFAFVALLASPLAACGKKTESITILNFKPELASKWGNILYAVKHNRKFACKQIGINMRIELLEYGKYLLRMAQKACFGKLFFRYFYNFAICDRSYCASFTFQPFCCTYEQHQIAFITRKNIANNFWTFGYKDAFSITKLLGFE